MAEITTRTRLRYMFDRTMSRGVIALVGWLAVVSLAVVVIAGAIIAFVGVNPADVESLGFLEASWLSLMRTLDAGTMGGDQGWAFRIAMLIVTIGGIFIVSTLIGVLATGIDNRLTELRKGRSFVVERDHVLILGWSSKVFTVVSELVIANANQRHPRIIILADKDLKYQHMEQILIECALAKVKDFNFQTKPRI